MFGHAIDENFDGIHQGRKIADIRYRDELDQNREPLNVGIHLKSRERPRSRGLGRGVKSIKGLYTQYCYSAYSTAEKGENLNAIGVSVPNVINDQVIENFEYLANQLGFPLIILAEQEWLKILGAGMEKDEIAT